ncbi:MAG: hypothetical protein MN733_04840, partial [Nitrososphaera sp.]|nr:hypothetical protein [Nitrososphaera sp.]
MIQFTELPLHYPKTKTLLFIYMSMFTIMTLFWWDNTLNVVVGLGLAISTAYISFIAKRMIVLSETEIIQVYYDKITTLSWSEIASITDYRLWIKLSDSTESKQVMVH